MGRGYEGKFADKLYQDTIAMDIVNDYLWENSSNKEVFFVKHFSLKKASEFPFFSKGISLLSAGIDYASRRMRACSIR